MHFNKIRTNIVSIVHNKITFYIRSFSKKVLILTNIRHPLRRYLKRISKKDNYF